MSFAGEPSTRLGPQRVNLCLNLLTAPAEDSALLTLGLRAHPGLHRGKGRLRADLKSAGRKAGGASPPLGTITTKNVG
jgi:hypothetical protein